jgi:hypothetical protein
MEASVGGSTVQIRTSGCGSGTMPRPMVDSSGRFEVDGTYLVSVGPPPPPGSPAPAVHFSGTVSGDTLTVSVQFANGQKFGPFAAVYGSPGRGQLGACP